METNNTPKTLDSLIAVFAVQGALARRTNEALAERDSDAVATCLSARNALHAITDGLMAELARA